MASIDLKKWRFSSEVYTSPMLNISLFKDYKGRIIREKITADFDDARHIIKIPVGEKASAKGNLEKLQRLGWVD